MCARACTLIKGALRSGGRSQAEMVRTSALSAGPGDPTLGEEPPLDKTQVLTIWYAAVGDIVFIFSRLLR